MDIVRIVSTVLVLSLFTILGILVGPNPRSASRRLMSAVLQPPPTQYPEAEELTQDEVIKLVMSNEGIHGKVEKHGMLPRESWLVPYSNAELQEWLWQQILVQGNASTTEGYHHDAQPPKAGPCTLMFNPVYKFVFVKNTKVAGTTLFVKFGRFCDTNITLDAAATSPMCMWPTVLMQATGLEALGYPSWEALWADYTVLALTRNPFDRAGSSYDYLLNRREGDDSGVCRKPTFEHFTATPYVLGVQDKVFECGEAQHDLYHVEPQTPCLVDENGEFAVDFIVRAEALKKDLQPFYDKVNEKRLPGAPPLEGSVQWWQQGPLAEDASGGSKESVDTLSHTRNRHVQKYIDCGSACVTNIKEYYEQDFQTLQYPMAL